MALYSLEKNRSLVWHYELIAGFDLQCRPPAYSIKTNNLNGFVLYKLFNRAAIDL